MVSSYLSGRTQRCNVSGKLSSAHTLSCGVPQGSILGPLLFLTYINDLRNSLRGAVPRMFADDTNLTLSAKTLTELKLALTPELNAQLSWGKHVEEICKKVSSAIGALKRVRPFISSEFRAKPLVREIISCILNTFQNN